MESTWRVRRIVLAIILAAVAAAGSSTRPAMALAAFNPSAVKLQPVASGLTEPVLVTNAGDGSGRLFIVEHSGRIRIVKNGSLLSTPFLDIHTLVKYDGNEQGLLGLAFHAQYGSNGLFYVTYTAPRSGDSTGSVLTLERFSVSSGNPDVADPAAGSIILAVDHPTNENHNGGTLMFGPDGYLYWSTGDGGSGGDPPGNAQNLNVRLGKILRIDVDHTDPGLNYAIPPSNPFVGISGLDEIWAYGLRNPWRLSFDKSTGDLWIADVGQNLIEEIDLQPATSTGGENYGWNIMEGTTCFNAANFNQPLASCNETGKVLPISQYDHSLSRCAITGGYVYRGQAYPAMGGQYFYGDYCSGAMYTLHHDPSLGWVSTHILDTGLNISSFGQDEAGELYVCNLNGSVYRIVYITKAVRGDFDGNRTTDVSVYRPSSSSWYVKGQFTTTFGLSGDIPIPADYNDDGQVDVAVFRPSNATWYVQGQSATGFGQTGDVPVPGDYNGDGTTDIAVYRPSTSAWFVRNQASISFGLPGDIPVPGDYNGDGIMDIAVYRPSTSSWFVRNILATAFGLQGDIPIPGDYNGDGITDLAVFRPSTNAWYLKGQSATVYGLSGDVPVPGDYNGDGTADIAVFRPSMDGWFVRGQSASIFGMSGDYPLPAPDTNADGVPYQ